MPGAFFVESDGGQNGQKMVKDILLSLQDAEYGDFSAALMPTVPRERIIGVRTPVLRKFAREFAKSGDAAAFLSSLPHYYYEENNLHAFLIEQIRDFDSALSAVNAFLPFVDNWATCDSMSPKVFGKNCERLLPEIYRWIKSDHVYTVRFGIGMLMRHFLGDRFRPEFAEAVAAIRSDEYYVQMMAAWYFATALAHNRDEVWDMIPRLSSPVREMAVRKAIESRRISAEDKEILRGRR